MDDATWDELLASLGLTPSTNSQPDPDTCGCAGDRSAYQKHVRLGEDPCLESRAANTAYERRRIGGTPRKRSGCGTYNGYQAHKKRGEDVCEPCAEARRERDRAYYAARKAA